MPFIFDEGRIDRDTLRLPADEHYQEVHPKRQIVIHHTVGGSAKSTFNWWLADRNKSGEILKVGTAYIIERDGTIYEVFDPRYWAHHLGLKHRDNTRLNQQSIGIELASEGPLIMTGDALFDVFGKPYKHDNYIQLALPWRGYAYFDEYDEPQLKSAFDLVAHLCDRFQIPGRTIVPEDAAEYKPEYLEMAGVIGHCNIRPDKSDPHPLFPWADLAEFIAVET